MQGKEGFTAQPRATVMLFSLVLGCRKGWGWAAAFPENRNWQEGTEEWMFPWDQYVEIPHLGKGGDGAEQELRSPRPQGTGLSRSTPTQAAVSFPSHRAVLPFWAFASLTASTRSMPLLTAGFFSVDITSEKAPWAVDCGVSPAQMLLNACCHQESHSTGPLIQAVGSQAKKGEE